MNHLKRNKEICIKCKCKDFVNPTFLNNDIGHCLKSILFSLKYIDELPIECNYKLEQLVIHNNEKKN